MIPKLERTKFSKQVHKSRFRNRNIFDYEDIDDDNDRGGDISDFYNNDEPSSPNPLDIVLRKDGRRSKWDTTKSQGSDLDVDNNGNNGSDDDDDDEANAINNNRTKPVAVISSKAVNDSSRLGIDRLGFTAYAQAIYNVLKNVDSPLCIGLYAKWGSGKSFLIQRLKYNFDKSVAIHPYTKELLQWYEEDWIVPITTTSSTINTNNVEESKKTRSSTIDDEDNAASSSTFHERCCFRITLGYQLISSCFRRFFSILSLRSLIVTIFPQSEYVIDLLVELILVDMGDLFRNLITCLIKQPIHWIFQYFVFVASCIRGELVNREEILEVTRRCCSNRCMTWLKSVFSTNQRHQQRKQSHDAPNASSETEYVFVDFNAWEFSQSDELWAGLIRNIYQKVEKRLQQHQSVNFFASRKCCGLSSSSINQNQTESLSSIDYKHRWRLEKGKQLLIEHYGGMKQLKVRIWCFLFLFSGLLLTLLLSIFGFIDIWAQITHGLSSVFSVIAWIIGVIAFAIPTVRLLMTTNQKVNESRGDAIFQEANRIQDKIGFLSRVRTELEELFSFMRQFEKESQIKLILVIFVDDLDRCLQGRNVIMLEAIQLLLAIPGAPVLCFLAIDSRVVVASIEQMINQSLDIRDALISGYEYMDKIVQVPFCIPDPSSEKMLRYVQSCVTRSEDPQKVMNVVQSLIEKLSIIAPKRGVVCLKFEFPTAAAPALGDDIIPTEGQQARSPFYFLPLIALQTFVEISKNNALELVLALALRILPNGKALVSLHSKSRKQHSIESNSISTDELVEMISRSVFHALKTAKLVIQKDYDLIDLLNWGSRFDEHVLQDLEANLEETLSIGSSSSNDHQAEEMFAIKIKVFDELEEHFPEYKALLPDEMCQTLLYLCSHAESNPRRFKRVLNVIAIAYEVAKCKSMMNTAGSDPSTNTPTTNGTGNATYNPTTTTTTTTTTTAESFLTMTIAMDPRWSVFSMLMTKWIFLCELYPYRMSFLVQIIYDWKQKQDFNDQYRYRQRQRQRQRQKPEDRHGGNGGTNGGGSGSYFLHVEEEIFDMNIIDFYYLHVEKYIYTITSASKLLRLDSDPELFATLLSASFLYDENTKKNIPRAEEEERSLDITCGNVIGMDALTEVIDTNFSLMSYSFNLNPSMIKQIGIELQEIQTAHELVNKTYSNEKVSVLLTDRHIVQRKADIVMMNATSRDEPSTTTSAATTTTTISGGKVKGNEHSLLSAAGQGSNHGNKFNNTSLREAIALWFSNRQQAIQQYGHISLWDTSQVTDMQELFLCQESFNDNINEWDVSNVITMENMFANAICFNSPLSKWDVGNVTNMSGMFSGAIAFNQSLKNWKTHNVINMTMMFNKASSFNQLLHKWDVSQVQDMSAMFSNASSFNRPLDGWDTSSVRNMSWMFHGASAFNQALDNWNVEKVTNMKGMFREAIAFNQSLNSWNVSNVMNVSDMFAMAKAFNQSLDKWNVDNAKHYEGMFDNALSFRYEKKLGVDWVFPGDDKDNYDETNGYMFNRDDIEDDDNDEIEVSVHSNNSEF